MKKAWKDIVEGVGILAIVASLLFVGLQIRQDHRIAVAQIRSDVDAAAIELSQTIHEQREIWRAGLDGKELSADDELTFMALARAVEATHRGRYQRMMRLNIGDPAITAQNYAFQLYLYPGLRRAYVQSEMASEYRDEAFGRQDLFGFRNVVSDSLAILDNTNPPVHEKDYLPVL